MPTPFNEGNVFVPEENYQVFLNKSSVVDLVPYSGVIVEKVASGFIIKGYDYDNPKPILNCTILPLGCICV